MTALDSAERAARVLLESPVVFLGAAALGVLKLPVEATRPFRTALDVYAVLALLTFAFTPALLAGLYALAAGALRGEPARGDFWEGAGDGYLDLLLANLLYATLQHLLLLAFTVLALLVVVVGVGAGSLAEAAADPRRVRELTNAVGVLTVAGVVLVSTAYLGVRFAVAFLLVLYKPAAALDGHGPFSAFRESVRLVRGNVDRTLGFVLVRAFATLVLLLPGVVAGVGFLVVEGSVFQQLAGATAGVLLAVLVVVGFALGVVELAFLATYRVAFYRSLSG